MSRERVNFFFCYIYLQSQNPQFHKFQGPFYSTWGSFYICTMDSDFDKFWNVFMQFGFSFVAVAHIATFYEPNRYIYLFIYLFIHSHIHSFFLKIDFFPSSFVTLGLFEVYITNKNPNKLFLKKNSSIISILLIYNPHSPLRRLESFPHFFPR